MIHKIIFGLLGEDDNDTFHYFEMMKIQKKKKEQQPMKFLREVFATCRSVDVVS